MAAVAILGVALNMQYSLHHVLSLLDARLPPISANTACVLGLGVPLLVLAVGNVYCGHLCPFGALQELLGELRPRRLAAAPSEFAWRIGGAVKYVVLALGVILASCGALDVAVAVDPLVGFFGGANSAAVRALAVGVLAAAVFYPRFWCRTLCPSGAFLALINRVALLRRWMPVTRPSYCDLGVRSHRQIDCISCDRCRLSDAEIPPAPRRAATRLFVAAIALAVVVIAAVGIAPSVAPSTAGSLVADGPAAPALEQRELRRVDIDRLKELIGRGTLSDREAEFCSSGAGGVTPTGETSPHRAEGGSP
jgi:hypothetical protein